MGINSCFLLLLMMLGVMICTSNNVAVEEFKSKRSLLQETLTTWNKVKAEESRFNVGESSRAMAYLTTHWNNFWGYKGKAEMQEREIRSRIFKEDDEKESENKKVDEGENSKQKTTGSASRKVDLVEEGQKDKAVLTVERVPGSVGRTVDLAKVTERYSLGELKANYYLRRTEELKALIQKQGVDTLEQFERAIMRKPLFGSYARTSFWREMLNKTAAGSIGWPEESLLGKLRVAVSKVEEVLQELQKHEELAVRDVELQTHHRGSLFTAALGAEHRGEVEGVVVPREVNKKDVERMDKLGLRLCVLLQMLGRKVWEYEAAFILFWEVVSQWKLRCEDSVCHIMR